MKIKEKKLAAEAATSATNHENDHEFLAITTV